jgi:hypothetical protein
MNNTQFKELQNSINNLIPDLVEKILKDVKSTTNPNTICMTKENFERWKMEMSSKKDNPEEIVKIIRHLYKEIKPLDLTELNENSIGMKIFRDFDSWNAYRSLKLDKLFHTAKYLLKYIIIESAIGKFKNGINKIFKDDNEKLKDINSKFDNWKIADQIQAIKTSSDIKDFIKSSNDFLNAIQNIQGYKHVFVIAALQSYEMDEQHFEDVQTLVIAMFKNTNGPIQTYFKEKLQELVEAKNMDDLIGKLYNIDYLLMLLIDQSGF